MLLAFVFLLIGFGTKTGYFPCTPGCRMLTVKRRVRSAPALRRIAELRAVGADSLLHLICQAIGSDFPNRLLLIFGMCRLPWRHFSFWYSGTLSVCCVLQRGEHGAGRGGARHWRAVGIFAALLHILNHSLAKTLLSAVPAMYCSSTARAISTSSVDAQNHAIYRRAVWRRCAGAAGMPPFNIFLSEFMTITAGLHVITC